MVVLGFKTLYCFPVLMIYVFEGNGKCPSSPLGDVVVVGGGGTCEMPQYKRPPPSHSME